MKQIRCITILLFSVMGYHASAICFTPGVMTVADDNQENKRPVDVRTLPEVVRKALTHSDVYAGWQATVAFRVTAPVEYYEIELKKGKEITILRLYPNGQQL